MADTLTPNPEELRGLDVPTYKRLYHGGWVSSQGTKPLDEAEVRVQNKYGLSSPEADAWLDGWLDYAAGREKFHRLYCPNHEECP